MKPPEIVAVAFYVAIAVFSLYYGARVISTEPQLPCGVAEISPDFDSKHREQCRQMRGHKL
jgi:hypothetical protein